MDRFNSRLDTAEDRISELRLIDTLKLKQEKKKLVEVEGTGQREKSTETHEIQSKELIFIIRDL